MHLDSFANPLPTIDLTLFTLIVRIIGLLIIPKRASCGELRARVFPLQIAVDWRAGLIPVEGLQSLPAMDNLRRRRRA